MANLNESLQSGWQLHQRGQYAEAENLYRQAVAAAPEHPGACYLLGRLAFDTNRPELAIEYLSRATQADSSQALFHADLASAYRLLGRAGDAQESYRRSLSLEQNAGVLVNLGNLLLEAGEQSQAFDSYQKALELDPNLADAHSCLGVVYERLNHLDEAVDSYRRAIALRPNYFQAHYNLGTALKKQGRFADALPSLQAAIELKEDFALAHNNLGIVLENFGRFDEARQALSRAIVLDPQQADFHANLGAIFERQSDWANAERCFAQAVELDPQNVPFKISLASAVGRQGRGDEAIKLFDRAVALDPMSREAHCARGLLKLSLGQFESGWSDYEFRVGCPSFNTLSLSEPTWDGTPLGSRTLLIHAEQGLGDTLQFIRYVKLVSQQGGKIIVAVQPALVPLLEESGYRGLISREADLPKFDVHAPLLSLPRILKTRLDTIPHDVPYLSAAPERIEKWQSTLQKYPGLRIGISWQGADNRLLSGRSIRLSHFATLAKAVDAHWISLQREGDGTDQIAEVADKFSVVSLDGLDDVGGAFMDTAAVISQLDLVITSDNSRAHLAGALGAKVWVALADPAEWRWLRDRDDSPWYPTMRLFRQSQSGDWSEMFQRMAAELATLAR